MWVRGGCMQVAVIGAVEADGTFCEWKGLSLADVLSWYGMLETATVIVPQSVLGRCLHYLGQISGPVTGRTTNVRRL